MENKTTISALEELVNQQVKAYIYWCIGYDEDIAQEVRFDAVKSYYESDKTRSNLALGTRNVISWRTTKRLA